MSITTHRSAEMEKLLDDILNKMENTVRPVMKKMLEDVSPAYRDKCTWVTAGSIVGLINLFLLSCAFFAVQDGVGILLGFLWVVVSVVVLGKSSKATAEWDRCEGCRKLYTVDKFRRPQTRMVDGTPDPHEWIPYPACSCECRENNGLQIARRNFQFLRLIEPIADRFGLFGDLRSDLIAFADTRERVPSNLLAKNGQLFALPALRNQFLANF